MRTLICICIASIAAPVLSLCLQLFNIIVRLVNGTVVLQFSDLGSFAKIFLVFWIGSLLLSILFGLPIVFALRRFNMHRSIPLISSAFGIVAILSLILFSPVVKQRPPGSGYSENGVDLVVNGIPTVAAWIGYFQGTLVYASMAALVALFYHRLYRRC